MTQDATTDDRQTWRRLGRRLGRRRGPRRGRRWLWAASGALSWLTVAVAAAGAGLLHFLESRANWSGEAAPRAWLEAARASDILSLDGREVAYRTWRYCSEEFVTRAQLEAGLAVIRALQARYAMKCVAVYGHGDLQTDRQNFEGATLSRLARQGCALPEVPVPKPASTTAGGEGGASG